MNKEIQNIIGQHIIDDLLKYNITTLDAIGLLESIKLALFFDNIKKVEK